MPSSNPHPAGLQSSVRTLPGLAALNETFAGKALLAVCASIFVAVCAHVTVPLPFTPVPLTFSDFAVLLVGMALGPAVGFSALAIYLIEGASGLPVFNPLTAGGVAALLGPTGGYLLAYPFAAAIAGTVSKTLNRFSSRFAGALVASTLANVTLMVTGTIWLGFVAHLSAASAFTLGAAPFLPGQVVKVFAAAGIFASLHGRDRS